MSLTLSWALFVKKSNLPEVGTPDKSLKNESHNSNPSQSHYAGSVEDLDSDHDTDSKAANHHVIGNSYI